jgi:8-oxo-dGTP pyrophosphatase MutT (NUDIX family)
MSNTNKGAGILLVAQDTGRLCFVKRSPNVSAEPNTWSLIAGGVEQGEAWSKTARREAKEEAHIVGNPTLFLLYTDTDEKTGFVFKNFLAFSATELQLKLNWENSEFKWVPYGTWPKPLHPGVTRMLANKRVQAMLQKATTAKKLPSSLIYREVKKD